MAQTAPSTARTAGKTPFVIALVDSGGAGQDGLAVLRRATRTPHDVILVARNRRNPAALAAAVYTLEAARLAAGITPTEDAMFRVSMASGARVRAEYLESAKEWVRMLDVAAAREIDGVGTVPHVVVYLQNQSRHLKVDKNP